MLKGEGKQVSVWVALAAMLAQLFFSTAHMVAMAATVAGPVVLTDTPAGSLGLLEICTANGLLRISPNGTVPDTDKNSSRSGETCAVCASAAIGSFTDAAVHAVVTAPYGEPVPAAGPVQYSCHAAPVRAGIIRAPPLV